MLLISEVSFFITFLFGQDQVVVGEKTFTSDITVDGHLICPKINNLDIVELDASVFKTVENQNITEAYTFWGNIYLSRHAAPPFNTPFPLSFPFTI